MTDFRQANYYCTMRSDDPHDSRDIWRPSFGTLKTVIAAGVIGALCGAGAYKLATPRWTAVMTVQIGQTPRSDGDSRLIEPQATVTDRFNQPLARLKVVSELGLPTVDEAGSKESRLIFNTLHASTGRGADLINLEVTAYSREDAQKALEISFNALSSEHQKLFEPTVQEMKSNISAIQEKLKVAESGYEASYSRLQEGSAQKSQSYGGVRDLTLTGLAMLANRQSAELRRDVIRMRESMDVARTYPTRKLGGIYAPMRPKTPGWIVFVVAGGVIGMALGGLIAIRKVFNRPEAAS